MSSNRVEGPFNPAGPTAEQMAITLMCHMIAWLAAMKESTERISRLSTSPSAVKPDEKRFA